MAAYYNEHNHFAAAWLRNLIGAGAIAAGDRRLNMQTTLMAAGPLDVSVSRYSALRLIARKRKQARALHDCVLYLGAIPGRERDANNVSKEAAIVDAEVVRMLANLPANALAQGRPE